MTTIYLVAVAFGVTLLLASLLFGGEDADAGDAGADAGDADLDADADADGGVGGIALAWAPVMSLRFWVFMLAFGGGAGLALTHLGSSETVSAIGALGVGWAAGALAVMVVHKLTKNSVSSEIGDGELVGITGTLVLPVAPGKPGKVRVDIKGRSEDFVANLVDDGGELPSGTPVLIVAEGEHGALLVAKGEM